jgi:hypothetical protein
MDPMCAADSDEARALDMNAEGRFCRSFDDDMIVMERLYEVRDIVLPSWLSAEEWSHSYIQWGYMWGRGVSPLLPEAQQRYLLKLQPGMQVAAGKLLATKKFRSSFRADMRAKLEQWIATPAEQRQYDSPFSARQWDCIVHPRDVIEAKRADNDTYSYKGSAARGVGDYWLEQASKVA